MQFLLGAVLAGVIAGPLTPQTPLPSPSPGQPASPPIFQPGAPGAASRVISAGDAVALSRTTFTPGDVAFMQHMIVHHGQAVEMVGLLEAQGESDTVKLLGRRIAMSQEAEIEVMRTWLRDRGQPLEMAGMGHAGMDHSAHEGHAMPASETALMPGMLSPAQMQRLAAARGADFDRLFLEGMIQHHQGALDMVDEMLARPDAAEDPMLSDFASSVVGDQTAEIRRMQFVLSDL
ncbi:DUF305 domain-containing protein [Brevundimonas sp. NPDC092305]|uniref:DUF305 domain-containing protein n=1 Tax=Brevundimonas sp. NPDC092305 TaxID=3363957 RepID=UPI00381D33B7